MNPVTNERTVSTPQPPGTLPDRPGRAEPVFELAPEDYPNLEDLVTEDDTPVDSFFAEKQQRLLTEPLYSSWPGPGEGKPFLAPANVGLFYQVGQPPLVPDVMLSLGVRTGQDLLKKANHSYFLWIFGKPPEVVIEIVSDRRGGEDGDKMQKYCRIGVPYYVIFDPNDVLGGGVLRAFGRHLDAYEPIEAGWFPTVGLGVTLWQGEFEACSECWLRWCDRQGQVIATGRERADLEQQRAEAAQQRAARLEAQLRALGIEPTIEPTLLNPNPLETRRNLPEENPGSESDLGLGR